jgi:hypothetical protein
MEITEVLEQNEQGLVGRVLRALEKHHLNRRTEQAYLHWICRFVLFHDLKSPEKLENNDQVLFLDYLKGRVLASRVRLNQARNALAFFYHDVLGKTALPEPAVAPAPTGRKLDRSQRVTQ